MLMRYIPPMPIIVPGASLRFFLFVTLAMIVPSLALSRYDPRVEGSMRLLDDPTGQNTAGQRFVRRRCRNVGQEQDRAVRRRWMSYAPKWRLLSCDAACGPMSIPLFDDG